MRGRKLIACWPYGVLLAVGLLVLGSTRPVLAKSLSEGDLATLLRVGIAEDVIVAKIRSDGVDFAVDQDAVARLKQAGASEAVLQALQAPKAAAAAAPEPAAVPMAVWVKRQWSPYENPLHAEFSINGQLVDIFTSDTQKEIGKYLKKGWNTISVKTTPQEPANDDNQLIFSIGPVHKDLKTDKSVMGPVLWEFRNGTDWKFQEGKFSHRLGPGTKEVTLNYRLYFAGLDLETARVEDGDYLLQGSTQWNPYNSPLTATVFVNGVPLNGFLGARRQIVVTPLLKQGKNELRIVSARVKDALEDNDIQVELGGPFRYNPRTEKFEGKPIVQFQAMQGWEREKKSGQLISKGDPQAETVERVIPFVLDEAPARAKSASAATTPG